MKEADSGLGRTRWSLVREQVPAVLVIVRRPEVLRLVGSEPTVFALFLRCVLVGLGGEFPVSWKGWTLVSAVSGLVVGGHSVDKSGVIAG